MSNKETGQRLSKFLSGQGLCSRREVEKLILEQRITVNGKTILSPVCFVSLEDRIEVDGEKLKLQKKERPRLWRFHKPKGYICTDKDPEGRPTIYDYLESHYRNIPRVISVGRLDLNSEGLLLLTDSGNLSRHLELPSTGWTRTYKVRVKGIPHEGTLKRLLKGVSIDGIRYKVSDVKVDQKMASNAWLTVKLKEGKNREIRRIFESVHHPVSRLIRVSYGPFLLGALPKGALEEVPEDALRNSIKKETYESC